jgi:gliding motility-associated protein GldM
MVHEYLADEGVLNTGTDKFRYQALLINQVAEESLICLSSGFNHSLIKKRIVMMTKSNPSQVSKLRILTLIPLAIVLFIAVACFNGKDKSNVVTAVEPVKMNVLYIGVDNPVKIAASGYDASDLTASVNNGNILGKNGEYIIRPKEQGTAIVTISSNGKEIQRTNFRVKGLPDPVVKVAGLKRGKIAKSKLLKENKIVAEMENIDFDLTFEIVEFTLSTAIDGFVKEVKSNSCSITPEQKDLISNAKIGQHIYIQEIKCKGPDGIIREMGISPFTIAE